jgi:hypothetical protein
MEGNPCILLMEVKRTGICIVFIGDGDMEGNPCILLMEVKLPFASPKCMTLLES